MNRITKRIYRVPVIQALDMDALTALCSSGDDVFYDNSIEDLTESTFEW